MGFALNLSKYIILSQTFTTTVNKIEFNYLGARIFFFAYPQLDFFKRDAEFARITFELRTLSFYGQKTIDC